MFSPELSHNAMLLSSRWPWVLVKSLWPRFAQSKNAQMLKERIFHSFHSSSVYFHSYVVGLLGPVAPPPATGAHQASEPDCSVVSLNVRWACWHGRPEPFALQSTAFIVPGAGCYLGALSMGATLVTLYGRINKTLQTKPWSPKAKVSTGLNHQLNSKR